MKKIIKNSIKKIANAVIEYLDFIFNSAAENQIRLQRKNGSRGVASKFSSYCQLKRYQAKLRKFFLLTVLFVFGMLVSQIMFPRANRVEVFIPEGEGEILVSNIKKNGAMVVFKTLDAANFNKPLATVAEVQVFGDPELKKLVKATDLDDYAVTHMINITGLEEGKDYYLKIIATDSPDGMNAKRKKELAYQEGKDQYLKIHTGVQIGQKESCEEKLNKEIAKNSYLLAENEKYAQSGIIGGEEVASVQFLDNTLGDENLESKNDGLEINNVMHESALYEREKVQAIVSWRTNRPATTTAIYREGRAGEEREVSIGSKFDTAHMAVFTSFKPGTMYYFKVKSVDENGMAAFSDEFSLFTPKRGEGMTEIVLNDIKQIFKQIMPVK